MAQVSIDNVTPEIAKVYLQISAKGRQQIKDTLEKLILQQARSTKPEQPSQLIQAIKDFRVNQPLTQAEIKALIEEGRE